MTARLRTIAFWLLAAALLAGHAIVVWQSLAARFWEDEAFNLTVPLNLLSGLGYSSDGALSGSTITPFDPRISTGPPVLLPVAGVLALGADPVLGSRVIPVAYWVLLLAGLALLGKRIAGRWAALLAVAVPLAFNGAGSVSPIQGPADLLGEIPAAALIVWALLVLPRRAWLAGLLVGLAVQAKLIALLVLPAFAVMVWVLAPGHGLRRIGETLRRGWLPLVLAGLPTLIFELAALVSLGPDAGLQRLRGLARFVRGGGQLVEPTTVTDKLLTLLGAWFAPWWLALIAASAAVALVVAGLVTTGLIATRTRAGSREASAGPAGRTGSATEGILASPSRPGSGDSSAPADPSDTAGPADAHGRTGPEDTTSSAGPASPGDFPLPTDAERRVVLALGVGALVGAAVFIGWWSTASHTPLWVRHPATGVLAFIPVVAIIAVWSAQQLWAMRRWRAVVSAAVLALVVPAALGAAGHVAWTQQPQGQTLERQRAAVAPLAEWVDETGTEWLAAQPWGAAVSAIVLSGAHVGLWDAEAMRDVPRLTGSPCQTEVLAESPAGYRICAP